MPFKIGSRCPQDLRIVVNLAENEIAAVAEQATDLLRLVAVIHAEMCHDHADVRLTRSTNRTPAALFLVEPIVLSIIGTDTL